MVHQSGRTVGYSPQRATSEVIATQNNWNVLAAGGWTLDTGVMLTVCGGNELNFDDECLENNMYSDNICVYSNRNFKLYLTV